jgi:hypothetical protein
MPLNETIRPDLNVPSADEARVTFSEPRANLAWLGVGADKTLQKTALLFLSKTLRECKVLSTALSKRESVRNMNTRRLFETMLIVVLVAVAYSQIYSVKAGSTRDFTLYGSYLQGWGFTASNITSPGPTIVVEQGDTVNLTLISNDAVIHRFFVSYTNASSANSTEPQSSDFTNTLNYQFVATNSVGMYTYGCYYHYSMGMKGYFQVVPAGTIPEFQPLAFLSLLIACTTGAALMRRRKRQV